MDPGALGARMDSSGGFGCGRAKHDFIDRGEQIARQRRLVRGSEQDMADFEPLGILRRAGPHRGMRDVVDIDCPQADISPSTGRLSKG